MTEATKHWEGQIVEGLYPLRQFLGSSDHSAVFLTEHGSEKQKAAIKLVPADPATSDRALAEWESAAELVHPNLLKLLDGGKCRIDGNNLLYLVMEYAEENLAEILRERALTADEARQMLDPVLDALEFLHGKGFVHGDVKPANILAIGDKLKLSSDAICRAGEAPAMPKKAGVYDPPEAISGVPGPAGDVWALGTTLVEVLTQRLPDWQPGPHVEPTVPATIPAPFLEIARQCLRVDPQRRINIGDISAKLSARAALASAAAAGSAIASLTSIAAPTAPSPTPVAAAQKPVVVSQAVPARPAIRPKAGVPMPRPEESREKPRFMVPLIIGALVLAAVVAVPRLMTHRTAEQPTTSPTASGTPTSQGSVPNAGAATGEPHSASTGGKQGHVPEKTITAAHEPARTEQPAAQPPAVEAVKSPSDSGQPSATPAATTAAASEKVARTAIRGSGSGKGEVLDQILPDVSQKARDTIHGKVRVSVKVHVDAAGAVSDAELDSAGPSKYFADLALQAAKKWVFSPPEIEGKSVVSEWRLRFDFRQKETKVVPTQTAP